MQFLTTTIVLLSGLATTVLPDPTETMEIDGLTMQLITNPALIFTGAPVTGNKSNLIGRVDWPVSCGAVGDLAGFPPASGAAIQDGVEYLIQQGTCTIAPNSITRVSCSFSSGIFVQNRETHTVVQECSNFGVDASKILHDCWNNARVIGRRGTAGIQVSEGRIVNWRLNGGEVGRRLKY